MLAFFWISVFFSPIVDCGGVFLRVEQFICPLVFAALLLNHRRKRLNSTGAKAFLVYAAISVGAGLMAWLLTAYFNFVYAVRWPAVIALNVIAGYSVAWCTRLSPDQLCARSLKMLQWLLFAAGLIGVLQYAEWKRYLPTQAVNSALAKYYPYQGELADSELRKTRDLRLKMGSTGRVTSVFDGQPNRAADCLALGLLLTLPLARRLKGIILYAVPTLALFLTLSRGSIIGWMFGVLVYFTLLWCNRRTNMISLQFARRVLLIGGLLLLLVCFTPLGGSIVQRVQTTLHAYHGVAGHQEERLESEWPEILDVYQQCTLMERLFGFAEHYPGMMDSQYFLMLVETGVVGIVLMLGLHLHLARRGYAQAVRGGLHTRSAELGVAFVAAILALLLIYVTHPALQGRRLLTMLAVTTMFFLRTSPARALPSRNEVNHEGQGHAPDQRSRLQRQPHFPERMRQSGRSRI